MDNELVAAYMQIIKEQAEAKCYEMVLVKHSGTNWEFRGKLAAFLPKGADYLKPSEAKEKEEPNKTPCFHIFYRLEADEKEKDQARQLLFDFAKATMNDEKHSEALDEMYHNICDFAEDKRIRKTFEVNAEQKLTAEQITKALKYLYRAQNDKSIKTNGFAKAESEDGQISVKVRITDKSRSTTKVRMYINGKPYDVLADNMHVAWTLMVRELLKDGDERAQKFVNQMDEMYYYG